MSRPGDPGPFRHADLPGSTRPFLRIIYYVRFEWWFRSDLGRRVILCDCFGLIGY